MPSSIAGKSQNREIFDIHRYPQLRSMFELRLQPQLERFMFVRRPKWVDTCLIGFYDRRKLLKSLQDTSGARYLIFHSSIIDVLVEQSAQCSCLLGKSLESLLLAEAVDVDCTQAGRIVADSVDKGTVRRDGEASMLWWTMPI